MFLQFQPKYLFTALSFFLSLIVGADLFEDLAIRDMRLFFLACMALAVAMNILVRLIPAGFRKLRANMKDRTDPYSPDAGN